MKQFKKVLCTVLSTTMMVSFGSCRSPEEQEKINAENKENAIRIAEKYFGEDFKYDFDFYGGGGEGDPAIDIYVFTYFN